MRIPSKRRRRLRGRYPGSESRKALESVAAIAVDHNLDANELFRCLADVWENCAECTCNNVVIRCRKKTRDSAIFLFTNKHEVLAQFPIPEQVLHENNPIKAYIDLIPPAEHKRNSMRQKTTIGELEGGDKGVKLKARVLELPQTKSVYTRYGTQAYVSNALIADETGSIRLTLWNQQITQVAVGDVIEIEKARVVSFRGEHQLRLGKTGEFNVIDNEGFPTINQLQNVKHI